MILSDKSIVFLWSVRPPKTRKKSGFEIEGNVNRMDLFCLFQDSSTIWNGSQWIGFTFFWQPYNKLHFAASILCSREGVQEFWYTK